MNALLEHFLQTDSGKVQPILETLVECHTKLDGLIRHQYANHTIQVIIDHKPEDVSRVVCDNFQDYASHQYANYVVQKCITTPACRDWLLEFARAFIDHKNTIETNWNSSVAIRRTLGNALKKRGEAEMARRLERNCPETQGQRQHQKGTNDTQGGWDNRQGWVRSQGDSRQYGTNEDASWWQQ